jgi:hypothetical protein
MCVLSRSGTPPDRSAALAAARVRLREVRIFLAMSASFHSIPWNSPMGWPNCSRSPAYSSAISKTNAAIPLERAAFPRRSQFSASNCCLNASAPPVRTFSSGTTTSFMKNCVWGGRTCW